MRDSTSITLRIPRRLAAWVVAAVAGLGLVSVGVAGGARLARPTSVAVVDLGKVLQNLAQRESMLTTIQQMETEIVADGDARIAEVRAMLERMQTLASEEEAGTLTDAGRAEFDQIRDDYRMADLSFKAWDQRSKRRVDREKSFAMQDLFKAVTAEIAAVADASGYDVVLTDDSGIEPAADPRQANAEAQIAAQMRARRILYVGRQVDITQDVIDRMNNAWNAGG